MLTTMQLRYTSPPTSTMPSISDLVSSHRPDLTPYITLYKHFHAHPELSHLESATAGTIATQLKTINPNLTLHTSVGGHGIAAVLSNGHGPTVLLRADIDGLPVAEKTQLPYASTATQVDSDGVRKPTMHACGHDMHITSLLAATELLSSCAASWAGTLVLVFQPAEERGAGARRMVDSGLYSLVPTPDVVLGGHVMPYRSGTLGTKRGLMASAADSLRITLYGRGGHASQPHRLVDPVVMAAATVMRLQGIVAREVDPADSAVVSVTSVRAGEAENVVPDEAVLRVNVRNVVPETRKRVLAAIERIVRAESVASAAVKEPGFETTSGFPFTFNDEQVTERLELGFGAHFEPWDGKAGYMRDAPRLSGSEDFGILGTSNHFSYFFLSTLHCVRAIANNN